MALGSGGGQQVRDVSEGQMNQTRQGSTARLLEKDTCESAIVV